MSTKQFHQRFNFCRALNRPCLVSIQWTSTAQQFAKRFFLNICTVCSATQDKNRLQPKQSRWNLGQNSGADTELSYRCRRQDTQGAWNWAETAGIIHHWISRFGLGFASLTGLTGASLFTMQCLFVESSEAARTLEANNKTLQNHATPVLFLAPVPMPPAIETRLKSKPPVTYINTNVQRREGGRQLSVSEVLMGTYLESCSFHHLFLFPPSSWRVQVIPIPIVPQEILRLTGRAPDHSFVSPNFRLHKTRKPFWIYHQGQIVRVYFHVWNKITSNFFGLAAKETRNIWTNECPQHWDIWTGSLLCLSVANKKVSCFRTYISWIWCLELPTTFHPRKNLLRSTYKQNLVQNFLMPTAGCVAFANMFIWHPPHFGTRFIFPSPDNRFSLVHLLRHTPQAFTDIIPDTRPPPHPPISDNHPSKNK